MTLHVTLKASIYIVFLFCAEIGSVKKKNSGDFVLLALKGCFFNNYNFCIPLCVRVCVCGPNDLSMNLVCT